MGVFVYGRMNPPTKGHRALIEAAKNKRINKSQPVYVFATSTQNKKNNPLSANEKKQILNTMFAGNTNVEIIVLQPGKTKMNNAIRIMRNKGVTPTTLVLGQNRINKGSFAYVENAYGIKRVSGGNRNLNSPNSPNGTMNIKKISASKARQAARANENLSKFMNNKVPKNLVNEIAKKIKNRTTRKRKTPNTN